MKKKYQIKKVTTAKGIIANVARAARSELPDLLLFSFVDDEVVVVEIGAVEESAAVVEDEDIVEERLDEDIVEERLEEEVEVEAREVWRRVEVGAAA